MPNFTSVLKTEIARIARKENKSEISDLGRKLARQRREIIELKRTVASLKDAVDTLKKHTGAGRALPELPKDVLEKSRLGSGGVARIRSKLGLSRAALGKLLEVNQNSIYLWESGKVSPRKNMKAKLVQLRKLGKRAVKKMLKEIAPARKTRKAKEAAVQKPDAPAPSVENQENKPE